MSTHTIYQVDAFTNKLFGGNPAAVIPLESWLDDVLMQQIAAENNLAETVFFVPKGDGYHIRWFTPELEIDLCGHEFAVAYRVHFAVAKTFACRHLYFIHNERAFSLLELVNIFEAHHCGTIRPANFEIGCTIKRVIQRTREMEVVVDECFDSRAIFVRISLKTGSSDCQRGFTHSKISF